MRPESSATVAVTTVNEALTSHFTFPGSNTHGYIELQNISIGTATQALQDQEEGELVGHAETEEIWLTSRRPSVVDEEQTVNSPNQRAAPVSWSDLPNKTQLAILTIARLSEPLSQASLQAYMFYQLRWFDPTLPESTILFQAGVLQASFTAAQFLTAMLWGRIADADWGGRKRVLLIGILGACVSCVGYGFSTSFVSATLFRTLGGAMNGNPGVSKTMVSEIIREKRFQSRAFLLLPMCFNIGIIIGPILGGLLASPVENYPKIFGDNSILGGQHGVWWMKKWPYALPNLVTATFLFNAALFIFFGLEETLGSVRHKPDLGLRISKATTNLFRRKFNPQRFNYSALNSFESHFHSLAASSFELETRPNHLAPAEPPPLRLRLPLRRIWTRNVLCTLLAHGILAFHVSTFQTLWFVFLSTPRFDPVLPTSPTHLTQTFPFKFTGGLGMPSRSVGFAMAILGTIGISLQLLLYPSLSQRLGTIKSFRLSLLLFPLAYILAPYLAIIPSTSQPPAPATGILLYATLTIVLFIQVLGRTFALPATVILVNNSSPHPSVLGTVHGVAQSVNSGMRTLGPVLGGWGLGAGLRFGVVGAVWWALAAVAAAGWMASGLVYEGSGHEIFLEGEIDLQDPAMVIDEREKGKDEVVVIEEERADSRDSGR